jgi:hypothetical protein
MASAVACKPESGGYEAYHDADLNPNYDSEALKLL